MSKIDKRAFGATLAAFAGVLAVIFIAGLVSEHINNDKNDFQKAEGLIEDLNAMALEVPRLPNGVVVSQGELSTAWLDRVGALPVRLQAAPGSVRGQQDRHSLGIVRRSPWSGSINLKAQDSLILGTLTTLPKKICQQIVSAAAKRADQVAYITTFADPVGLPANGDPTWLCRQRFINLTLIAVNPATEYRQLSADIQNALSTAPKDLTGKQVFWGSSVPFQLAKDKESSPGYVQYGPSGLRVAIANLPLSVCRLALLAGPQALGMDSFETADGKSMPSPQTRAESDTQCTAQDGQLFMSHR
jgi:hypothetical protein